MKTVFWLSVASVAYVYVGYPMLLAAWARLVRRAPAKRAPAAAGWPSISIVVAARNEAARLGARVGNLLEIAYPGRREVIVVSDGSTDDPAAALRGFDPSVVRLIEVPAGGKPRALNAGVASARGEILVFADARQRFSAAALVELVANFSDPRVGGATGELVLDAERHEGDSTVADGVGLYWKYEKWMRRNESRVWSTLGATGAIYALRRALWRPLPAETLLDDVLAPMRAVLEGYRIVFDERAVAYDRAAPDAAAESRRKVRTLAGNYQIVRQAPALLVPFANPVWVQYVSHKIGRLVVPWALLAAFVSNAWLVTHGWTYTAAFVLQCGFYGLAAAGGWAEHRARRTERFAGVMTEAVR